MGLVVNEREQSEWERERNEIEHLLLSRSIAVHVRNTHQRKTNKSEMWESKKKNNQRARAE